MRLPTRRLDAGFRATRTVLRETVRSFTQHGGTLLGGALAFFALLSSVPMLVIMLELAGRVTGAHGARAELVRGLRTWMGRDGARTVVLLLEQVRLHTSGRLERAVGTLVLVYGSTRLFSQTQRALNHMWDVTARPAPNFARGAVRFLRRRVLAFAMVVACALFLFASTVTRTALVVVSEVVGVWLPPRWHVLDHALSVVITTALFGAVFKWLADVTIHWRDALAGALFTSGLFVLGKVAIAWYLAHKTSVSVFGVAGSVIVLLLWVHYTAQIFFLGAAFTAVRARRAGRALTPSADALRVSVEDA
jgi:membrane protein